MSHNNDLNTPDPGIDKAIAKLTTERIEQVVNQVLDNETAARMKIYLNTCVHCGLCSEACHTYLSRDKDPRFSPVGKVKQTLWRLLETKGRIKPDELRDMSRIVYTECGTCRRCSMYCPFGIDIAYLIMTVRRICNLLEVVPQNLQDTAHSHSATMNQMWIQQDEWIDTLMWQEEEAQADIPDLRIPLDKEGAEIMYSVIAPEPKIQAHLLAGMAKVMTAVGADWTMPSLDGWDNSNLAMFSGDFEVMAMVERAHWEAAEKLRVKRIVMGECGHAYRGAVYDGPRFLGWQYPPIKMTHAIEFYYDLLVAGKIKIKKKYPEHVTVQDPCNTVRGLGLGDKLRYIINATCEKFTEVTPNREHNYCCMAGGGAINCGPIWKNSRMLSNRVKAEQLAATGAHICVSPCHNCHSGLDDIIDYYGLEMHTKFIIDILMETMEFPE